MCIKIILALFLYKLFKCNFIGDADGDEYAFGDDDAEDDDDNDVDMEEPIALSVWSNAEYSLRESEGELYLVEHRLKEFESEE